MNISSEIFTTDGSNSSDLNSTEVEVCFKMTSLVDINVILLGFPINSYVIWLIVTGTGNGLAAEFFGLNLAVCEIFICMESVLALLIYKCETLWIAKEFLDGLAITGRPLFQCLMCVERYLAVVHPVIFLKYKPLRYRVICSVIVWVAGLLSCGFNIMTLLLFLYNLYFAFFFVQFFLFLSFQLFFCLAVLRALKQSGPGERGREKEKENHMKRRAFYLILITNVILIILYAPYIIFAAPQWISANNTHNSCLVMFFSLWRV